MLENEVSIEQDRLDLREDGIVAVDVGPARLHHPDSRSSEVVDGAQQEVFRRSEVGVEDGDEFTLRRLHSFCQRSRLETLAVCTVMVADGMTKRGIALDQTARDFNGFVSGVVEHLYVKFLFWIFQLADGLKQPLDDILLIEDRKLHRDPRQIFERCSWLGGAVFLVLVIQVDQDVPMRAVAGKQDQNNEIRSEQREIECVGLVETLECLVQNVLADVGKNALGRRPE